MEREEHKNTLKKKRKGFYNFLFATVSLAVFIGGYFFYKSWSDSLTAPLVVLAIFNFFLLLVLLYILLRQLVKGYLEWRREKEGARIRTRLLTAFVTLGLIPSILLLIGAIIMVESAVESWFRLPVHTINEAGQRLVDASLDILRENSFKRASGIANQMKNIPENIQNSFLNHISGSEDFDAVCLIDSTGNILFSKPQNSITLDKFKIDKIFSETGLKGYIILGQKSYVFSSAKINKDRAVLIGYLLPENLLKEARFISENQKLYLQAKSERKVFKISMISSFLALTLAVIFAAVWIGTRLTREINKPLQLLLEGTAEVSKGNLDHRIEYQAKDEIGQVVSSFNKMVEDLLESKREVEKSNEELRAARDSAEKRRNYIEVLVESLNVGIISLGADGEIVSLNKKAREFLELSPKDPPQKAVTLPSWVTLRDAIADLKKRPQQKKEILLTFRDEAKVVLAELIPLTREGISYPGSILIIEDITDLSRTQRIAAWQEVAQRLAHEIKNPLTPIRLSAQRIRKKLRDNAEDLNEAIYEGTTTIEREVESMMSMVNEFSRFARLPEIHLKSGSIADLVLAAALPYQNAYSKVSFSFNIPDNIPNILFDQEQIERVIKNLFENSIEAMKMSGEIRVSIFEKDKYVVISIKDTGPGIPQEIRTKMFLPYFSTKRKGTGLGLAIVARILEEHGGKIEVDNEYSEGAGLLIYLPR